MDFQLSDDRRMLAETLSRFLADNYAIDQRHGFVMLDDRFSRDMWSKFAELGVIGALFPESAGGFGGEGDDITVVFEALGRHLVVEPFLPTLLAGSVLSDVGGHEALIENTIAGEALLALGFGEPAGRYELSHVETKAKEANGSYTITGNKSVVMGGNTATHFVVSARTSGATSDEDGVSLFLIEKSDQN